MIHPTAVVHPKAKLHPTVKVGPYAVIDADVEIGPECVIGSHVYITGVTRIGARNQLFCGCVIGEAPQDLSYRGEPTELRIGDDNQFREHTTVHRSSKPGLATVLGSQNLLMATSHVGHNCELGNRIIIANGAMLGGYAKLADRVFVSGNCLIHQGVFVGTGAMMQGGAGVSKDVPPYTMASGINSLCGLNTVGMRRAGISSTERLEAKRLYHLLFRSGLAFQKALQEAETRFTSGAAKEMLEFIRGSRRGVCFQAAEKSREKVAEMNAEAE